MFNMRFHKFYFAWYNYFAFFNRQDSPCLNIQNLLQTFLSTILKPKDIVLIWLKSRKSYSQSNLYVNNCPRDPWKIQSSFHVAISLLKVDVPSKRSNKNNQNGTVILPLSYFDSAWKIFTINYLWKEGYFYQSTWYLNNYWMNTWSS